MAIALAGPVPVGASQTQGSDTVGAQAAEAELEAVDAASAIGSELRKTAEEGLFLVRLADPPVATYEGGRAGLPRTRPDLSRGQRLNPRSAAARAYRNHLGRERGKALERAAHALGRQVRPEHVYDYVLNGFSAHMTPDEAARLAAVPGVVDVQPDVIYELHTDNGPAWIGADAVWGDGSDPDVGTRGEGVLVGIIDTGINPGNPSFAEVGPIDGYVHTNPFGDGNFVGACDPGNPQYQPEVACNNKLVGAWNFVVDGDPAGALDVDGHGSHTGGTVAGNLVEANVESPTDASLVRTISGVAPHANIISYRGCRRDPGCPLSALVGSINQAVADGVDVINYSIGGGSRDPWTDDNALAFLDARAAGIFVATSAGNSGPGASTVGSPADAPWLTSVGASTHDRNLPNTLTLSGAAGAPGPFVGKSFSSGFGPATIVSAGDYPNPNDPGGDPLQCLEPYPSGTFDGEIVVCERGTIARVDKGANVLAGGAGGLVLMNDPASGGSLNSDPHFLPAVHISNAQGQQVLAWLADGSGHQAEISGAVLDVDDGWGDVMAAFSSRGPNAQMDIISPNVTAPGVDIIAAHGQDDPDPPVWTLVSGTSMSSPHVAGTGALLAALRPEWSPAEMQSALMTTAITSGVRKEDATTPADWFDMGSGRVDVSLAANAGLVLDETIANYEAADPAEGGDPKALNLPSMANSQCLAVCTWTRTVTATDNGAGTWQVSTAADDSLDIDVSPSSFTLAAGESQVLTVSADVAGAAEGSWLFGNVVLTHDDAPTAHLPVAVIPTGGVLPDIVEIDTRRDAGSQLVRDLQAVASPALTADAHGLARATIYTDEVSQDPANGNPYSPLDANWWTTFEVPADTLRLVAEIFAAESPDLDLFIGTGTSPSLATEVCRGTTAASFEYCDIDSPDAGTWWVMVQAWQASAGAPDAFSLAVASVPEAATTMTVEAPDSVDEGEPFDVRVFWDADMEAGDRWYGAFTLSSSPDRPGDIGTVPVDLVRHGDDVTKTVDATEAERGDTLTYEITVAPNVTPTDLTYTIEDTIPEGLTYVEGSATGGATVTDGVVSWSGTMPSPRGVEGDYSTSTNQTDPSCATPFGDGGWIDFQPFGISPIADISGDGAWNAFASGDPIQFYGREFVGTTLMATGITIFDFAENFGSPYWIPQNLPDTAAPNNLVASLWQDFEVVYDAATNRGVRLVTLGGTGPNSWIIIDYDRVELFGGSADTWSHQIWMRRTPNPAGPDIVVAYNDLGSLGMPFTVGTENPGGTKGTAHVNAQPGTGLIDDDTVVCFSYEGPSFDPHVITYQVTVDSDALGGTVTNAAVHDTDNPGSQPATASVDVEIAAPDVAALDVQPDIAVVAVGATTQLTATATLTDGSQVDVTAAADWTSASPNIATVSETGLVAGQRTGTTLVTASYAGFQDTSRVNVRGGPATPGGGPNR